MPAGTPKRCEVSILEAIQSEFQHPPPWPVYDEDTVAACSRLLSLGGSYDYARGTEIQRGDVGITNVAYAEAYMGTSAPLRVDAVRFTPISGLGRWMLSCPGPMRLVLAC